MTASVHIVACVEVTYDVLDQQVHGILHSAGPSVASCSWVYLQVVSAAASGVASFAATSDGTVWVWGSSKRGQLGLGPGVIEAHQPKRIPDLKGVRQLAAGWGHVLALKGERLGCIAGLPASAAYSVWGSCLA